MGHSIQTIGRNHLFLDDLELLVVIGFMVEELGGHAPNYPAIHDLLQPWREVSTTYGPGTIDLHLDRLAHNSAAENQLHALLRKVILRLSGLGPVLPAAMLNTRYKVEGVRFYDYPTSRALAAATKLLNFALTAREESSC